MITEREKGIARSKANVYRRRGKIHKYPCEVCGARDNIEGHHDDYSKPLQVRWLCRAHHKQLHVAERRCSERLAVCPCGEIAVKGQSVCKACHAAQMRTWRLDHPYSALTDEDKRKNIARAKVNVYVKRGKIQKTPCPCCGSEAVKARILDYADPLHSVEWLCAESHAYAVRTGHLPMIRRAA